MMRTFKDNAGRTWTVSVDVAAVKRVRSMLDVDLLSITNSDGRIMERLVSDPILLCDVIYVVCKPDADQMGVSDEDFGRAMGGDAIELATTALLEELVGFFPNPKRQMLAKALTKLRALETQVGDLAMAKLDSPELEAELRAMIEKGGGLSGISPAGSASTPAP